MLITTWDILLSLTAGALTLSLVARRLHGHFDLLRVALPTACVAWVVLMMSLGWWTDRTVTQMAIICRHARPMGRHALPFTDAVGVPIMAECAPDAAPCRLTAAGFDGIVGTRDDLHRTCTPRVGQRSNNR